MHVILQIQSGPARGRTIELTPGQIAQVGRSGWADLAIPEDPTLAGLHFLLECGPDSCRLRDLGSPGGTSVNQARTAQAILRDRDQIRAGQTRFTVSLARAAPPPPAPTAPAPAEVPAGPAQDQTRRGRLLALLRGQDQPLFALLDAARAPQVLGLLLQAGQEHRSLYEGVQGEALAAVAPYLVRLPASCSLLEDLVRQGWGRSWGVYLTCDRSLLEVRKHLRHFLLVNVEGDDPAYFRFYDPRVLRVFLPAFTADEAAQFFGPIDSFLLEGERAGTLWRFVRDDRGVRQEEALSDPATAAMTARRSHPTPERSGAP